MRKLLAVITLVLLIVGFSTVLVQAEDPPTLPNPFNGLYNSDFELDYPDLFPYGWNEISGKESWCGIHRGLTSTGLAAEGTQAALLSDLASLNGEMIGQEVVSGSTWELSCLLASLSPGTGRSVCVLLPYGDNTDPFLSPQAQINLRVAGTEGTLQAYDNALGWVTLGAFSYSIDGDSDGLLESEADTLNVQTLKIVGNFDDTPSYDVYLSYVNSEDMQLLASDIMYYQGTAPEPDSGLTSVNFLSNMSSAAYVVDEVSFVSELDSIPGDANNDFKVDGSDVTILAGNWQVLTGATWEMGDFNGDGAVDGSDVTILAGNWQFGVNVAAASVPEPSAIALLLLLAGMAAVARTTHQK